MQPSTEFSKGAVSALGRSLNTTCMSGLITTLPIDLLWHPVAHSLTQWKWTWVGLVTCQKAPCGIFLAKGIRLMGRKAICHCFASTHYLICAANFRVEPPWFFILNCLNYTYLSMLNFVDQVTCDFYLEFHINNNFATLSREIFCTVQFQTLNCSKIKLQTYTHRHTIFPSLYIHIHIYMHIYRYYICGIMHI